MKPARRKQLEKLALERLHASDPEGGSWSHVWSEKGAVDFLYCPWDHFRLDEFDGWVLGLKLPWTKERLRQIEYGEADPNKTELQQWRRAMCRYLADEGEMIAWITPMREGRKVEAYALWLFSVNGAAEDPPHLRGVYDTSKEAKEALRAEGVIGKSQRRSKSR